MLLQQRLLMCVVVVVACLAAVASGQGQQQSRQRVFEWKVQEYPDPFSYDTYRKCGRHNKSNICDPNHLIPKAKSDRIDNLIWRVFRETRCKCAQCIRNGHGYVIRVAVMPRIQRILKHGNTTEDMLRDARLYAYILSQQWAMGGNCNESVLILFSRYDGLLYTLTLPLARQVLKDEHITHISMTVRDLFDNDDTIGDGLLEMIGRYQLVFEGDEKKALRPRAGSQHGGHASFISPSLSVTFLLSALLVVLNQ